MMHATMTAPAARKLFLDIRSVCHGVATVSFLALFPGYLVYHYLLATEMIPPVFGGLIGNAAILIAAYCIFLSFYLLRSGAWGGLDVSRLFVLAWCYYAVWGAMGALTVAGETYGFFAIREVLAMLVYWLAMFFIGTFFRLDGFAWRLAFGVMAISILVCLVAAVFTYGSLLGPLMAFSPPADSEVESSTYQGAGRSIVITSVVAAAYVSGQWRQLGILALAVIALLSLGSRTYFVAGAAVLMFWVVVAAVRHKQHVALGIFVAFAGSLAYSIRELFLETRAAELLDLTGSASWQERLGVQGEAVRAITSNPLLGDFAYHIRDMGPGGYAHNALSAWPEYGLIGFLLYLLLIASFAITALRHAFSKDPLWQAAVGLNVVNLLVVLAEPVYSLVPAIGWGFVVNALLHERRARRVHATRSASVASA
jgi:hypothetical protein